MTERALRSQGQFTPQELPPRRRNASKREYSDPTYTMFHGEDLDLEAARLARAETTRIAQVEAARLAREDAAAHPMHGPHQEHVAQQPEHPAPMNNVPPPQYTVSDFDIMRQQQQQMTQMMASMLEQSRLSEARSAAIADRAIEALAKATSNNHSRPTSSSDHIKRPESFSGLFDNNTLPASQFLEVYQGWVDMAYPSDITAPPKYFLSCLKGSAAQWYLREVKNTDTATSWELLKTVFLKEYHLTNPSDRETAYQYRFQKQGEKVTTFSDAISLLFNRHNLNNKDRLAAFCRNLLPTLQTGLRHQNPTTMVEAMAMAQAIEDSQNSTLEVAGIAQAQSSTLAEQLRAEMKSQQDSFKAIISEIRQEKTLSSLSSTAYPQTHQLQALSSTDKPQPQAQSMAPMHSAASSTTNQNRGRGRGRGRSRQQQQPPVAGEEPNPYTWKHGDPPQWFTKWMTTQTDFQRVNQPQTPAYDPRQQSATHPWPTRTRSPGGRFYTREEPAETGNWGN
jgi:hypothetical protein